MVQHTLCELQAHHPSLIYNIVLAYLPQNTVTVPCSLYPEGLERVPKRYAINRRNEWMVDHSDAVIAYVTRSYGGAAQCIRLAERKGIPVFNLSSRTD